MGFDWLVIDMQHGTSDYSSMLGMLQGISTTDTTPFVRVPWNDPSTIMRALDAGAYGVIVPLVNNREEAERAVAACRYPPVGERSSGPVRAAMYGGDNYLSEANDNIAVVVMIETAEALENLDDILSVEGVDAAYIGPSDLAYAIGIPPTGDNHDPKHIETVHAIFDACKRHGVAPGVHTGGVEFTNRWLDHGFQMGDARFRSGLHALRRCCPAQRSPRFTSRKNTRPPHSVPPLTQLKGHSPCQSSRPTHCAASSPTSSPLLAPRETKPPSLATTSSRPT